MNIMKKINSLLFVLSLLVSTLVGGIVDYMEAPDQKENYFEPVSSQNFSIIDAYTRGQGVATDGKYFYFSSNYGFIKTELDARTPVKSNLIAIPMDLLKLGCSHIGGITVMNGIIYAPIEDSKVFEHLYIAKYDAETLEHIESVAVPLENHEFGIPWCVADPEKNVIYSARRDYITDINVYDADTLQLIDVITVEAPVHKVQGGDMYRGILYLSVSREDQAVYALDLASGKVRKAFARNLVDGTEGEGMCILPMQDGSLFHVLDIASIRVNAHFRHYAFDTEAIEW